MEHSQGPLETLVQSSSVPSSQLELSIQTLELEFRSQTRDLV
jgi:hypothetical protein